MKRTGEIIFGGIAATAAMMATVYLEHFLSMIEDNPATFAALLFGDKMWIGFTLYIITGLIFAFFYSVVFSKILSWIRRNWARGIVYGIVIAILIEISLFMTAAQEVSNFIFINIFSTILAYTVYGLVLGITVRGQHE